VLEGLRCSVVSINGFGGKFVKSLMGSSLGARLRAGIARG
jgi:hypothetical protein